MFSAPGHDAGRIPKGVWRYVSCRRGVACAGKLPQSPCSRSNRRLVSTLAGVLNPPGPIRTHDRRLGDELTADQPILRYGEPGEVTKPLLFLAADATFSTGAAWVIG